MSWFVAVMGGGVLFFGGVVLLALAVVIRAAFGRPWGRTCSTSVAAFATISIAFSATPLPNWLYAIGLFALAAWLFAPLTRVLRRGSIILVEGALLATIVAMLAWELPFEVKPSIPARGLHRLYVVGDSITAGIGREQRRTWPEIIREQHGVEVVDFSHAGAGASDELRRIRTVPLLSGLVLLEIGGNDVLGHVSPQQFRRDLDTLVERVSGSGRVVAMLELPLFPFDNAYGAEQRSVARRRGVILIPRRYFAAVLSVPGATVDGIHLSAAGQQRMAEMIWDLFGRSLMSGRER